MKKHYILLSLVILITLLYFLNIPKNTYSFSYGKRAIFIGDSITYGHSSTPKGYGWANFIYDNYDFNKVVNAGKSGWLISNYKDEKWLIDQIDKYKNDSFDYVILHGGFNDIAQGAPLGSYNKNDYSGKYDTSTFLGGLEYYIYLAKNTWKDAKIGYIINYKTPNFTRVSDEKFNKYYTSMREVLEKWNISYLDLYHDEFYNELLEVNTNRYIAGGDDNIHLNREGYDILSPYIYEWISTL